VNDSTGQVHVIVTSSFHGVRSRLHSYSHSHLILVAMLLGAYMHECLQLCSKLDVCIFGWCCVPMPGRLSIFSFLSVFLYSIRTLCDVATESTRWSKVGPGCKA